MRHVAVLCQTGRPLFLKLLFHAVILISSRMNFGLLSQAFKTDLNLVEVIELIIFTIILSIKYSTEVSLVFSSSQTKPYYLC